MADEFGHAYARVIAQDLVISDLGDKTANQALASGIDPRIVWFAVCQANAVPSSRWHGQPEALTKRAEQKPEDSTRPTR